MFVPDDDIILRENTDVYILPTINSTVFHKTKDSIKVKKIKSIDGFTKVVFEDGKVGWVNDSSI